MSDRKYPDLWVDPENDPRIGAAGTDEKSVLLDYLRHYRLTLEMKCEGLDAEQLARRSVPPSALSLLGLIRHLADVELGWFRQVLSGEPTPRFYRREEDRDADFHGAVADDSVVTEAWQRWRSEVANAERVAAGLDDLGAEVDHHGRQVPVRDVLVHMIEEYARHCGHADLLRECIDGRTGQ